MRYEEVIRGMKHGSFHDAKSCAVPIVDAEKRNIGMLIPVGSWLLQDESKLEEIRLWRQRTMKMFMTQFETSYQGTFDFIKNMSVGMENRILFLIFDDESRFVGHIGLADINDESFEVDNLVRGVAGGNPGLIHFSERALLDWAFDKLKCGSSFVGVLSYNWMALALHQEVGYKLVEKIPLLRIDDGGFVSHRFTVPSSSNAKYEYLRLVLTKEQYFASRQNTPVA